MLRRLYRAESTRNVSNRDCPCFTKWSNVRNLSSATSTMPLQLTCGPLVCSGCSLGSDSLSHLVSVHPFKCVVHGCVSRNDPLSGDGRRGFVPKDGRRRIHCHSTREITQTFEEEETVSVFPAAVLFSVEETARYRVCVADQGSCGGAACLVRSAPTNPSSKAEIQESVAEPQAEERIPILQPEMT